MTSSSRIILKKSSVENKIPQTSDLEFGELALNFADGRLYFKNTANEIDSFISDSQIDTDDIDEGTGNLYYTDSRVDSHLSGGTGVTYSSGNISIGQDVSTSSDVTFDTVTATSFSGDGSNLTGITAEETDTLDTVTSRGNTTSNDISTGKVTSSGVVESAGLFVNSAVINISYTVETGNNAVSAGPVSVGDGSVITVEDGARWVVV